MLFLLACGPVETADGRKEYDRYDDSRADGDYKAQGLVE